MIDTFTLLGQPMWAGFGFSARGLKVMEFGFGEPAPEDLALLDMEPAPSRQTATWHKDMSRWLKDYAHRRFTPPPAPVDTSGLPPFQADVVRALTHHTKPGQTVSYGELASLAGRPRAARAVGGTMSSHPFAFAVPCHRVLHSTGQQTRYGKGVGVKLLLLAHEGFDPQRLRGMARAGGVKADFLAP